MKTFNPIRKVKLAFALLAFIFISSCSKEVQKNNDLQPISPQLTEKNTSKEATPVTGTSRFATASSTTNSPYGSIKEIYQAYARPPILIEEERNEIQISDSANMVNMNVAIVDYLQRYPSIGYIDPAATRDPRFLFATMVYSYLEESGALTNKSIGVDRMPLWLDCLISTVAGYFDIRSVISELGTFSFETVWVVVKTAIKKYVGWFGAALLIYHVVTDCL